MSSTIPPLKNPTEPSEKKREGREVDIWGNPLMTREEIAEQVRAWQSKAQSFEKVQNERREDDRFGVHQDYRLGKKPYTGKGPLL